MNQVFIPKQLKIGQIVHLSDQQSELFISKGSLSVESIIELKTPFAIHKAQVVHIDAATIEVEILTLVEIQKVKENLPKLAIIQAVSTDKKFEYFLEKTIEIGVTEIFPVHTEYSMVKYPETRNKYDRWLNIQKEAMKQSRTKFPSEVHLLEQFSNEFLKNSIKKYKSAKVCLASSEVKTTSFEKALNDSSKAIIAIGPEKGWHSSELELFKKHGFKFAHLGSNILRTETASSVAATIFNFVNEIYK
jgi:16S rRNA (uracil1498-N3)-methyltransferase